MIREFKEEIERLRKLLSDQGISLANGIPMPSQPLQINHIPKMPTESSSISPRAQSEETFSPMKPSPPGDHSTPSSILQTSDVVTSLESLSSHPSNETSAKSSRSNKSSPRAKNHLRSPRGTESDNPRETVRVEKEYVEKIVEVEKIPESHLNKQKVIWHPPLTLFVLGIGRILPSC